MYDGKLEIVIKELQNYNIDFLGNSEVRWKGRDNFYYRGNYTIYYSGNNDDRNNGVGFFCSKKIANCVLGYNPVSDRIMTLRVQGHPINITIIQAYAPISTAEEEVSDCLYEQLQDVLNKTSKRDVVLLMGDFNAKIGATSVEYPHIEKFGLGTRNNAGQFFADFCIGNDLVLSNTMFQQHLHRLYTLTSLNGLTKNQIDYTTRKKKWKSNSICTKTFPGVDCGSDH